MKKIIILLSILVLSLSVTSVCAGLFGPDTLECDFFSIEIPDGYQIPESWGVYDQKQDQVFLSRNSDDNPIRMIYINGESYETDSSYEVIENFTEDSILFEKCKEEYSDNFTRAEFDKEGYHYIVKLQYDFETDHTLKEDVDLIKNLKETLKPK